MDIIEFLNKLLQKLPLEQLRPYLVLKRGKIKISSLDVIFIFLVLSASFLTRLWRMQTPENIVFDEIHFGNFTNFYIKREYFFDIHPPLAKFLIAFFGKLSEYKADIHFGSLFGKPYPHENYISLRLTPIIFSSLAPSCMYLAVRFASFSEIAALTASLMYSFDTTAITEGRFILTDGILHFFVAFSFALLQYWQSLEPGTKEWTRWMYISSVGMGFAISCKYTAMSLCLIIGLFQVLELTVEANFKIDGDLYSKICMRALQVGGPAIAVHLLLWVIHFGLLIYVGEDTSQDDANTYHLVNLNTTNSSDYSAPLGWPPLISRALSVIASIQMSNAMNYKPHPYMSRPIDWPLLTDVWVGFWSEGNRSVNCMGNVFVYYFAFAGVLVVLLSFRRPNWIRAMMFCSGWILSYFPFFGVPRTMFLYHYLIPLMFGCCCFGIALDLWLPKYYRGLLSSIVVGLSIFGLVTWGIYVYAYPEDFNTNRLWNRAWQYGRSGREKWVDFMRRRADEIERLQSSSSPTSPQ